ncbi:hypothetical protein RHCRD62_20022 [Rhodococcus sp. RD6.2]|nr:hypothetical protein RHCRD62_20022 [Rhodococcus sp. RD6.2]
MDTGSAFAADAAPTPVRAVPVAISTVEATAARKWRDCETCKTLLQDSTENMARPPRGVVSVIRGRLPALVDHCNAPIRSQPGNAAGHEVFNRS